MPPDMLFFWCCLNGGERNMLRELGFWWRNAPDLIPQSTFDVLWTTMVFQSKEPRKVIFYPTYFLEQGEEEQPEGDPIAVVYFANQEFWAEVSGWIADPLSFCPEPCKILTFPE